MFVFFYSMWSEAETVEQTDLAATLAVLMGVPIPTTSMGRIIPSTLKVSNMDYKVNYFVQSCKPA